MGRPRAVLAEGSSPPPASSSYLFNALFLASLGNCTLEHILLTSQTFYTQLKTNLKRFYFTFSPCKVLQPMLASNSLTPTTLEHLIFPPQPPLCLELSYATWLSSAFWWEHTVPLTTPYYDHWQLAPNTQMFFRKLGGADGKLIPYTCRLS